MEIPYMEKLVKHYAKNKKIEFLSISLDENQKKWKRNWQQINRNGNNLFARIISNRPYVKSMILMEFPVSYSSIRKEELFPWKLQDSLLPRL